MSAAASPGRSVRGRGVVVRVALLILALCAPAGVASAADPSPGPALRAFEDILVGEVVITPDVSGRSATLEVTTSIDAACAVVYGPDPSFGHIATDQDMAGGAHQEHRPVLRDLEPGSVIYYRLQGSGPDGTLYASATRTFRTPTPPSGGSTNLALAATVVEVSSEYSATFAGEMAIDGDPTTAWSSAGDGDAAFISLDLGREAAIGAVLFRTRSMADGSAITGTFRLIVDGRSLGPFPADEMVSIEATGRILRFDVDTSSGGNTGAIEIEVLATDGP